MSKKAKFDPSQKFETVSSKFDPSAAFETVEDVSMLESGLRGAAQGLSFGLADELAGALESAVSEKTYEQARDESRDAYREAEKANPNTYLAGDIGGSIATSFIPGLGALNAGKGAKLAEVAGKAALQGGLTGFGKSEADEASGLLKDTATGTAVGGALGAVGYGAIKGAQKVADAFDDIGGAAGLKQAANATFEQFKEPGTVGENVADGAATFFGIPAPIRTTKALKAGFDELGALKASKAEFAALQKTFGPGSTADLSQNDVLMQKLLEGGIVGEPNRAHELVASKFAQTHGGDAKQYLSLIRRTPEELAAAQSFNAIEAGQDLAPSAQAAFDDVRKAAGKQYDNLRELARGGFAKTDNTPVNLLTESLVEAGKYKSISGNTKAVLEDTLADLAGREGQVPYLDLEPGEQFDRLLTAKQRLGKGVKWASKNELPEGQQILSNTYAKFQGMLQKLDDMAAADKGYAGFKQLENNLFKKLGTVERGRIKEFDPIKMEKLFSGSASGRGLMAQVEKAKQMLDEGLLPPEQAVSVRALLAKIDEMGAKASLKREMGAFRYGDAGPSSPAIQRMQAIQGKDSPTTTAVRAPQLFLKMKAAASDAAKSIYSKPFSELNNEQRNVVSKYALWLSQNEGATDVQMARKIAELTKPTK